MLRSFRMRAHEGLNVRLGTFAGGRLAGLCRPTWIDFLLTELCNARCLHCDIWKNHEKEDSPTAEQWMRALSDLRGWLGPVKVTLTGGEALLKPFTVSLVEHGSRIGLHIELLTHGYWKDQRRIEAVARANPWRVTLSVDGIGATHNRVRGREDFFERTTRTIETLKRVRRDEGRKFAIRLKTVVMSHNIEDLCDLARFATQPGMDIFYQPIEQNYNTPEDQRWWEHTENWPKDPERTIAMVEQLRRMKQEGYAIANSDAQLAAMIPYFRDPDAWKVATKSHTAHEGRAVCAAVGLLQVRSNGDVKICSSSPAVGNIKSAGVREIWEQRPRWWEGGCCLERRRSEAERNQVPLVSLGPRKAEEVQVVG